MDIDLDELAENAYKKVGQCNGIYFLFNEGNLVYVGKGWNCFLRVAEHTRKESHNNKRFTHWNFIEIPESENLGAIERELIKKYRPPLNNPRRG